MSSLFLSNKQISRVFFESLFGAVCVEEGAEWIDLIFSHSPGVSKESGEMRTGSMSRRSALILWLLSKYFQPKVIVEVGTHIGRSTMALAGGSDCLVRLFTCDAGVPAFDPSWSDHELQKKLSFYNCGSTKLFSSMVKENIKADLFFFDGEIMPDDREFIKQLAHEKSVLIFDDCEGVTKGIENLIVSKSIFPDRIVLQDFQGLHSLQFDQSSTLAVSIPKTMIRLTEQQMLPLSMY